ncbi:ferritin-like domain-containing protein [Hymenobacter terricola]|uniref:ferritin-like domain-containing protein n=1 Tax=Hymenobacter terricola TaxID=2819236 RepID=UPI001B318623|nr:ferritin-like domain-containing protein [Hymenobacter terricola]
MPDTPRPIGSDAPQLAQPRYTPIKRRSFFMYAGATAGATALVLAGCSKDSDTTPASTNTTISLGTGDVGVLNYAYALEQLEAAFYAQVKGLTSTPLSPAEVTYFTQVAAHEAIHRDFLRAAINRDAPGKLLQDLTPNFSGIDFTKRTMAAGDSKLGILDAAKAFEDLGVAAYNGAGKLIKSPAYLVIAGQIVSVEARHAAYVRNLITPGSFAADDQVDATTGLDKALTPSTVIAIMGAFITQKLDASTVGH